MSFQDRAPKGTPAGGQFTATSRSEPSVSLGRPYVPRYIPATERVVNQMWDPKEAAPENGYSQQNHSAPAGTGSAPADGNIQWAEPEYSPGIRGVAEKVSDGVWDAYDALGDAASRVIDTQRGGIRRSGAPVPDVEGSFVGWGQMVPKFLRRK